MKPREWKIYSVDRGDAYGGNLRWIYGGDTNGIVEVIEKVAYELAIKRGDDYLKECEGHFDTIQALKAVNIRYSRKDYYHIKRKTIRPTIGGEEVNESKFMPKEISPHAILCHLQHELPEIEELYIVIKDKKGNYNEVICGETGGLAFAILVLQKYFMDRI